MNVFYVMFMFTSMYPVSKKTKVNSLYFIYLAKKDDSASDSDSDLFTMMSALISGLHPFKDKRNSKNLGEVGVKTDSSEHCRSPP